VRPKPVAYEADVTVSIKTLFPPHGAEHFSNGHRLVSLPAVFNVFRDARSCWEDVPLTKFLDASQRDGIFIATIIWQYRKVHKNKLQDAVSPPLTSLYR
jgi:hypothetical protein